MTRRKILSYVTLIASYFILFWGCPAISPSRTTPYLALVGQVHLLAIISCVVTFGILWAVSNIFNKEESN